MVVPRGRGTGSRQHQELIRVPPMGILIRMCGDARFWTTGYSGLNNPHRVANPRIFARKRALTAGRQFCRQRRVLASLLTAVALLPSWIPAEAGPGRYFFAS